VAQLIREGFGVTYHVDHVGRLLRDLGWSPQKHSAGRLSGTRPRSNAGSSRSGPA
jgi:transposase